MSKQSDEEPVEKINEIKEQAHQAARAESAPAPVRRYRAVLFQVVLVIVAVSFGVLTFLVKTMPSFEIDLQITRDIQLINFPFFVSLMNWISWPGFSPQSMIITGLLVLLIYGFGLHWEALMALIAAVFSTAINVIVKDLVQRARPTTGLINVVSTLNSYSF